jgi:ankyrin repeat protein
MNTTTSLSSPSSTTTTTTNNSSTIFTTFLSLCNTPTPPPDNDYTHILNQLQNLIHSHPVLLTSTTSEGFSGLILACKNGHYPIVEIFLQKFHCSPNSTTLLPTHTPIRAASIYGHYEIVSLLLQQPTIDVNAVSGGNRTALMGAVRGKHFHVTKLLLQQPGINVQIRNDDGETVFDLARNSTIEIQELLQHYQQ